MLNFLIGGSVLQAKPDATVEVQISEDMTDVRFDFYNK